MTQLLEKLANNFDTVSPATPSAIEAAEKFFNFKLPTDYKEFLSNIILIGSDGAEDAFGFDTTNMTVVKLPFIGMGHIANQKLSDTFGDFLSSQIKEENKGFFKRLFG